MSNHYIHGFNLGCRLDEPGSPGDYRILRRLPKITEIFMALRKDTPIRLGILDTETTGLDPASSELIEVAITTMTINEGGSLHDLAQPKSWLEQPSLPLEPKIVQVTGLTDADLAGQRFDDEAISEQISQCHVLVSHNARFDRAFLAARYGDLVDKPWGCTAADMDWLAHGLGGRSLGHLLYEAGYFYEAHRAGPDSWALACLLAGRASDGRTYAAHLTDAVRKAVTAQPFADLVNALERAARNGTRAHLDAHIVRALIGSDAYPIILQQKTKEMTDLWQDRNEPPRRPAEPNLDRSGSGIAQIAMNGASAGMMTAEEQEAVERAESRRALEAVEQTKRRKRRRTP